MLILSTACGSPYPDEVNDYWMRFCQDTPMNGGLGSTATECTCILGNASDEFTASKFMDNAVLLARGIEPSSRFLEVMSECGFFG